MPTHEEQHKQSRTTSTDEEELESLPTGGQGSDSEIDDQTDAILDEIDAVLESNAEEFVQSFVQKGGE